MQYTKQVENMCKVKCGAQHGCAPIPEEGKWIHFDYVPGENNVRNAAAGITGKLCIIGSNINKSAIKELFGIN